MQASGSHDATFLAALARAAIHGDRDALEQLLSALRPDIVRTARLIVGPTSWAAEDAAQDALMDVTRALSGLREVGAVRSWALRIAATRALKTARKERRLALGRSGRPPEELDIEVLDESVAALKRAFDRLPPRMRAVAVLRLHAGLSEEETAEVLGCSVGTVKSQLHEARRRLEETLRGEGLVPQTMSAPQR
jgi:RNA polymerase sigma factor (sigma-70 family)